jgi:hypothetical protein
MSHNHDVDPAALLTQDFWDERYGSTDQLWSGNPDQRLVDQVAAVLDPHDWQIVIAAAQERQILDPDGRPATIRDAVLRAQRRR